MDIPLDEQIHFDAITTTPSTGAAVDGDSAPTFAVYEEATDTDIGVGGNMTKRTSLTGNYRGSFTLSAANGFEAGKWYNVIGTGIVGGVTAKAVLKTFRVVLAEAVAGAPRSDVSHVNAVSTSPVTTIKPVLGLAVDGVIPTATNLTNAPTAGDFTATMKTSIGTAVAASAVASVTAGVTLANDAVNSSSVAASAVSEIQSGLATAAALDAVDNFIDTEIGALTTELAKVPKSDGTATWNATALASIQSEGSDALVAFFTSAAALVDLVWEEALADHEGTAGSVAEALADAGGAGASAADIADAVLDEAMSGHTTAGSLGKAVADILVDTAEIGAAGAGLTALGTAAELAKVPKSDGTASWNATALAAINAQADLALSDYDGPTNAEMEARTLVAASYATAANLATVAGYLDTEVAAILAAVDTEIGAIQTTLGSLFTTALSESYRADGATGTVAQLLYEINQTLGERSISGVTATVKKVDGSTTAFTQTLDDDTAPTSITHAA